MAVASVASAIGTVAGIAMVHAVLTAQRARGEMAGEVVIDPLTIGVLVFALAAMATIAAVLPARAAARIPPTEALRA